VSNDAARALSKELCQLLAAFPGAKVVSAETSDGQRWGPPIEPIEDQLEAVRNYYGRPTEMTPMDKLKQERQPGRRKK